MKIVFKILILFLIVSYAISIKAHNFEVDGIYYNIKGYNVEVTYKGTDYNSYSDEYTGAVTIPSTVLYNGISYSVTGIDYSAFRRCSGLTCITIPSTINRIGNAAFQGCSSLNTIYFNAVSCSDFSSYASDRPFYNLNITNITIGDNVQTIPAYFAMGLVKLYSVSFGNSTTSIGDYAFSGCIGLDSVSIPNKVLAIGANAFSNCSGLTDISIPEGITSIGESAFSGCVSLPFFNIPNSLIDIKDNTFAHCTGMTSVKVGDSVTTIGNSSFYDCSSLANIEISNSVNHIGYNAFGNCKSLISLSIGKSVKTIGDCAFEGCTALTDLYYNAISCTDFDSNAQERPFYNLNISNIVIGDDVKLIPANFAYGLKKLTSLTLGKNLTRIRYRAFFNCSALANITIPSSVQYIDNNAFSGCSSLETVEFNAESCSDFSATASDRPFYDLNIKRIEIGNGVIKIPEYFASGLKQLTHLAIGDSISFISDNMFSHCASLSDISFSNSIERISADAFDGTAWFSKQPDGLVYAGLVAYKYKGLMSDGETVYLKDGTISISPMAFNNCSGLVEVTIPKTIKYIGYSAFLNCNSLIKLTYNAISCEDFNSTNYPFTNTYISEIQIGENVERIPAYFVRGLTTLRKVSIGNSVTSIGAYAFSGCSSMTDLSMGNSLKYLEMNSFSGCSGLTNISIPENVTSIGTNAFSGCVGLITVFLPKSIRTIQNNAFYGCSNLVSLYCFSITPPVMESNNCFSTYNSTVLYVPYQSLNDYKTTYYWNSFKKIYGIDVEGNILAEGISLNATSKNLNVNQTFKFTVSITPDLVTNKNVNWYSTNTNIVTVDSNGLITAISDGNATITATTVDGSNLSATCDVVVTSIPASSISINKTILNLDVDETYQLVATITPTNATDKTIVWSSSDTTIATVSNNGLVIPNEPGDAVITASTTDGTNLSASCQVTVVKRVKEITLNESSLHLTLPETAQLTAFVSPNDATNAVLNWTSSKPSVATVDNNGFIISKSVGTTTIKATTTDGSNLSATCQVNVTKQYVNSILLNEDSLIMHIGETFQLIADVQPENASNPNLNWISNNSSVASVDNTGLITANSGGTTLILASATDGTNITSSCFIEVVPDYYIEIDTLTHIRGSSTQIVDLPVSLINKNPISGIQFDVTLPDNVQFNTIDDIPDIWLDDARGTRSHSISASKLNDGKYRILVTSSTSKNLKGNDGELVHMNLVLPQVHDSGDCSIILSNIIASEADETRHNLDNKSTSVHFYYIVGDADANAIVDIADHASTASKILGMSPTPFYFEAANVDANGSLDVVDLVGITNIALGIKPITVRQAPVRDGVENHLFCEKLNLNAGEDREITIGIDCGFDFAGFQMDLKLPNGLNLTGVVLGEDAAGLGIASETMSDGTIRILGTSFSDAEIDGFCRVLITLKVKANNNYMHGSEIEFLNILFAERNLTAHAFDASNIEYIEPSSIYELMEDARIYIEDGNIIVDTPFEEFVRLIAVDGRMVEYRAHIGHNVYKINANGIYIIHFNGKTIKVRL